MRVGAATIVTAVATAISPARKRNTEAKAVLAMSGSPAARCRDRIGTRVMLR